MPAVKYKLLIAVLFSLFAWMVPGQDAPAQDTAVATTSATELFGIMADGARFVYVFDVSGSTEGAPLRAARHELQASIERLQRIHQFQIVFYNHTPQVLSVRGQSPRLYWADEQNKRFARRFIQQVKAGGGTNHLDALRMALNMQPDVIFFYTDAESPQMDEDQLLKVRQLNGSAKIHAIEFGRGEKLAGENFLTQLAHENSGEYRYVDVNRWRRETNHE